jgi:hypothetical protein
MKLPLRLSWDAAQDRWASIIGPLLDNPSLNSIILKNVSLATGSNVVNHKLGRNLQGWKPTRIRSAATIYDQQDTNQTPNLTLILVSSAPVVVDLEVF